MDERDTNAIYAILTLFDNFTKGNNNDYLRFMNNGNKLSMEEMIKIAQHIASLKQTGKLSLDCRYNMWCDSKKRKNNEDFNNRGSPDSDKAILCYGCSENDKGLVIDTSQGIASPTNINRIRTYFMEQCGAKRYLDDFEALAALSEEKLENKREYDAIFEKFYNMFSPKYGFDITKLRDFIKKENNQTEFSAIFDTLVGLSGQECFDESFRNILEKIKNGQKPLIELITKLSQFKGLASYKEIGKLIKEFELKRDADGYPGH